MRPTPQPRTAAQKATQITYRKGRLASVKCAAHIPSAQPFFRNVKKEQDVVTSQ